MGLNTTGQGDTRDYVLGRGGVYLAEFDATTGQPLAYRFLGNAPEFSTSMDVQELLHQSSQRGLKVTDKRVEISRTINLSFVLDEVSQQNLALFFGGLNESVTNPAVAGIGAVGAQIVVTDDAELGRWYDLRTAAGVRASFSASSVPILREASGPTILTEGTDYEVDHEMGRVFLKATAANIAAGETLEFYSNADASAPATLKQMEALADTQKNYALKFICLNASESDEPMEFQFHSVNISPDGDSALLGDDWLQMGFRGSAQVNSLLGKTLTVMTLR